MKPTLGEIIGGVCVVLIPFLLIVLLHGLGVGQ